MYGSLDISTSGMVAQRVRMAAIAANIAGRESPIDENGNFAPFRERLVMMAPGDPQAATAQGKAMGVHVTQVVESSAELPLKWDPGNPYAEKSGPNTGYVRASNVDLFKQTVDSMDATRSYEANVAAAEATKAMTAAALRLLA